MSTNTESGAKDKPASSAFSSSLSEALMKAATPAQMERLTSNLQLAMAESQQILSELMSHTADVVEPSGQILDPFGAAESWNKIAFSLAAHPDKMIKAQMELWTGHMDVWKSVLAQSVGSSSRDKRFSDPEWQENPFFGLIRQSYEVNAKWLQSLVGMAEDLSPEDQRKAAFFTKQTTDAFSPTNFFATNPTALRAFVESGGQSVLDGLRQAKEDLKRGQGKLQISQVDNRPFEFGKNIASTKGKVVFRNDLIELIQYEPTTATVYKRPLLFLPPWINKFYILDLREENSMIRWLLDEGFRVFVVSWRSADHATKDYTWDDYVEKGCFAAVDAVLKETGLKKLNAVGYCIGGTMLSSALAYMGKHGDDRIKSATYFASQSDFSEAGDLLVFADSQALDNIRGIIDDHGGLMPGQVMAETFNYLRPVDLVWRYVVDNYMLGKKPKPFDLLYWNADQTNIPGPTHLRYLERMYRDNALSNGEFELFGEKVSLADIKIPVLFQAGRDDHIAPFQSIYKGARKFGGDVEFVLAGSGHIAGVINHPAAQKYQHWTNKDLPESPADWLSNATEHPGSWWPHWRDWLAVQSSKREEAEPIADHGLGDAPGSYVRIRLEDIAARRKT